MTMSLVSTINPKLELSPETMAKLMFIDDHDFSEVKRITRKMLGERGVEVTEEWLDAGVLALKQYYLIALIDGRNEHAISDVLDPLWHAHILDTVDYVAFCEELVGRYLHHRPLNHADEPAVDHVARLYDFTMRRYAECFTWVDPRFYAKMLERGRLVCLHGPDEIAPYAVFSMVLEAQSIASQIH